MWKGWSGTARATSRTARPRFGGPLDLARCRVEVTGEVRSSQFVVTVVDATDVDGRLIQPPPGVTLRGILD